MTDWIDAHTHLDAEELYSRLPEVLLRAETAGVRTLLLVNSEATEASMQKTLDCLKASNQIRRYVSFGIHPHHALQCDANLESVLLKFVAAEKVIALGEVGLDFYYDYSPRDVQIAVLRRQLRIALERNLPVVIHCRDAYGRLREILAEENSFWRGMIHCFTGTPKEAESLLDLGFYISFSGIVTFRNADVLRDAARIVPLKRILIETDAPYLAPVPYRGKTNEPAFVVETGKCLARLLQMTDEAFASAITTNFHTLFAL